MNDLVIEQCAAEILALPIPKFLTWRSRRFLKPTEDTHFLYTTYTGPKFARDVAGRLWEGATVTYVALQLAYHMGFEKVILIGVDHNFVTKGDANKTITSQGDDPNHFAPNYFGKGFKWQLPDLETSERAYRMAKSCLRGRWPGGAGCHHRRQADGFPQGGLRWLFQISETSGQIWQFKESNLQYTFYWYGFIIHCASSGAGVVQPAVE